LVGVFLSIVAVVGLFVILQRLLPALQFIGSLPILPAIGALTWGQLLLFALAVYFTYVGARDLPALVELTLLKRLPFDPAARYALTSVSRYLLIAAGVTTAFSAIGIAWGQVQWLVAAMGVGLGFGLQEIFANFVSGVILLFEQPIRVGDVVTIGDKTGQVNRIRIRATTLVDWDRKEYVIPNKDLVTGSLLNWTLSDQTNRVVINVGVAYGSDTELACQLLLEAAREQPAVLADPEPVATFDGFGEGDLKLVLRCFLPNLDNRLATIHALHTAIHRKFADAGLEIPFPQRDIHIRSVPRGLDRPPAAPG
jgi:potassium efflux system protein